MSSAVAASKIGHLTQRTCDNSPAYKRELLGRSQRVLPHSQHVPSGVAVSIEHQPAARAVIDAVRQGELVPMATARAVLTRVRRVHRHILSTGPGCLVRKQSREL